MTHGKTAIAPALLAVWAFACTPPPRPSEAIAKPAVFRPPPITVFRELAYAHPPDAVRSAYRAAMEERGLPVEVDGGGTLQAVTPDSTPGLVRVEIAASDTLATRVRVTYRYREIRRDFYHYPYHLPVLAAKRLDRSLRTIAYVQRSFATDERPCPEVPALRAGAGLVEPRLLPEAERVFRQQVRYTEEARRDGVQGAVYLSAVVSEEGLVSCVEVLSGLPAGLTETAVRALASAVFAPARLHGRPIAMKVVLPVKFLLLE